MLSKNGVSCHISTGSNLVRRQFVSLPSNVDRLVLIMPVAPRDHGVDFDQCPSNLAVDTSSLTKLITNTSRECPIRTGCNSSCSSDECVDCTCLLAPCHSTVAAHHGIASQCNSPVQHPSAATYNSLWRLAATSCCDNLVKLRCINNAKYILKARPATASSSCVFRQSSVIFSFRIRLPPPALSCRNHACIEHSRSHFEEVHRHQLHWWSSPTTPTPVLHRAQPLHSALSLQRRYVFSSAGRRCNLHQASAYRNTMLSCRKDARTRSHGATPDQAFAIFFFSFSTPITLTMGCHLRVHNSYAAGPTSRAPVSSSSQVRSSRTFCQFHHLKPAPNIGQLVWNALLHLSFRLHADCIRTICIAVDADLCSPGLRFIETTATWRRFQS